MELLFDLSYPGIDGQVQGGRGTKKDSTAAGLPHNGQAKKGFNVVELLAATLVVGGIVAWTAGAVEIHNVLTAGFAVSGEAVAVAAVTVEGDGSLGLMATGTQPKFAGPGVVGHPGKKPLVGVSVRQFSSGGR